MKKMTNTISKTRIPKEIHKVETEEEIIKLMKDFSEDSFSVYSRGHNWGYGCQSPIEENERVIALDKMNSIVDFDKEHGLITIQPGVTYQQLYLFLEENGSEWITPVHGGGPDCSVLGNILERGYGLTPTEDHFKSLFSLRAVLKDGSIYKGNFDRIGVPRLDKIFKYGIGPYYDGLFTQSGLGVVTQATIKLFHRPEHTEMFYFNIIDENQISDIVKLIKEIKKEYGPLVGGINLINKERILSMIVDYPIDKIKNGMPLSTDEIHFFAKKNLVTKWTVIGALYGKKKIVKSIKKDIKYKFKNIKKRSLFYSDSNRKLFIKLSQMIPTIGKFNLKQTVQKLDDAFYILKGKPSTTALKLAYLKNEDKSLIKKENLNPTKDKCGIIWYAPLVELTPEIVGKYIQFINNASEKFNINSFITLTTIDDICFDSTIPILFNKSSEQDTQNAWNYYQYLLLEGKKLGFYPYRLNIETQKDIDFHFHFHHQYKVSKSRY